MTPERLAHIDEVAERVGRQFYAEKAAAKEREALIASREMKEAAIAASLDRTIAAGGCGLLVAVVAFLTGWSYFAVTGVCVAGLAVVYYRDLSRRREALKDWLRLEKRG